MTPPEAFFFGTGAARRFAILWRPAQRDPVRGTLLFVPPFAEEMNKSRRMVALTGLTLAARGFAVLRIDPRGCGDSAGRFEHARWNDWLDDLLFAWRWLRSQYGVTPWLWSLRAGALLAHALLPLLESAPNLLLWQPVLSGRQHLMQFLRLRVAADAFAVAEPARRATTQSLMQTLASGQSVEVAGYMLPAALALPLAEAELSPPTKAGQVLWFETAARDEPQLSPASATRIAQWKAVGLEVIPRMVGGPPFWSTQEIEDCPALVDATVEALCRAV